MIATQAINKIGRTWLNASGGIGGGQSVGSTAGETNLGGGGGGQRSHSGAAGSNVEYKFQLKFVKVIKATKVRIMMISILVLLLFLTPALG